MRKTLLTFGFLSISIVVFPQKRKLKKYVDGYVVNNEGDTLHGKVKKLGFIGNCVKVQFIDSEANEFIFTTNEVSAYERENEIYRAVRYQRPRATVKDTVGFMKVLSEGTVNLYEHHRAEDISEASFVAPGSAMPTTRFKHEFYLERDGVMQIVSGTRFRKQMHEYFHDNKELQEKIWKREYRFYDLPDLVGDYNKSLVRN